MSKITEQSVRENLGLSNDVLSTTDATQTAILAPGHYHTFTGKAGRRYLISITNMDDSFEANQVLVFNLEYGTLVADLDISPLRNEATIAQMDAKGIRVYNYSKQADPGRPKVYVAVYPA